MKTAISLLRELVRNPDATIRSAALEDWIAMYVVQFGQAAAVNTRVIERSTIDHRGQEEERALMAVGIAVAKGCGAKTPWEKSGIQPDMEEFRVEVLAISPTPKAQSHLISP